MKFRCASFMLALLLLPFDASAGDGSHGALGWVCRKTDGSVDTAELYELAESKRPADFEFSPDYAGTDLKVAVEHIASQRFLDQTTKKALQYYQLFARTFKYLYENRKELALGEDIQFDKEAFGKVKVVRSDDPCKEEMIAHNERGVVRIDMDLYPHLSHNHKIGLWVHETIYFMAKFLSQPQTAIDIQKLTREIVRKTMDRPAFHRLVGQLTPFRKVFSSDRESKLFHFIDFKNADRLLRFSVRLGFANSGWGRGKPLAEKIVSLGKVKITDFVSDEVTEYTSSELLNPKDDQSLSLRQDLWDRETGIFWEFKTSKPQSWRFKVVEFTIHIDDSKASSWIYTLPQIETFGSAFRIKYSTDSDSSQRLEQTVILRAMIL